MMTSAMRHAAVLAIVVGWSGTACAVGNESVTVKFTGQYEAMSCVVMDGKTQQTVRLADISIGDLTSAGLTAKETPFDIPVQCNNPTSSLRVFFERGPLTAANGNLDPAKQDWTTVARNVQIQLLNSDGSTIRVGDKATMNRVKVAANTTTPVRFIARYYTTGPATAGTISTYVTFVLQMD